MNIPKLPTDNLYKFLAISGLIMAIASFGAWTYFIFNNYYNDDIQNSQVERSRIKIGKEILGEEKRRVQALIARYENQYDCKIDSLDFGYVPTNDSAFRLVNIQELESKLDHLMKDVVAMKEKNNALKIREAVVHYHEEVYKDTFYLVDKFSNFFLFFLFLGFGIMFLGFKFWFERSQKYQDFIVQKQAGVELDVKEEIERLNKRPLWKKLLGIRKDDTN